MLLEILEKERLELVNTAEVCKGKWTRQLKDSCSIIDYIIVSEEDMKNIEEVIIDEQKLITPYRISKVDDKEEEIYTDHNAILCRLKWNQDKQEEIGKKMTMTKNGLKIYRIKHDIAAILKRLVKMQNLEVLSFKWTI